MGAVRALKKTTISFSKWRICRNIWELCMISCCVFALNIFWGLDLGFFFLRKPHGRLKKKKKIKYLFKSCLEDHSLAGVNFFFLSPFPGCYICLNVTEFTDHSIWCQVLIAFIIIMVWCICLAKSISWSDLYSEVFIKVKEVTPSMCCYEQS